MGIPASGTEIGHLTNGLTLTADELAMLGGDAGEATRLAMRILVRMMPMYGATSLLPITRAHIDGCIYEGDAGLEFAERLAAAGGRVRVPTSLNVISLDRERWREIGQAPGYADRARRLGQAYLDMGAAPTFTCAPYLTDATPTFGEQVAWAESNAVAYANSVIGARTNRYGDYLDISCALVGRVPAAGLHLTENRRATDLFRLVGVPTSLQERDDFWPVLGYLLGQQVTDGIPVVDGVTVQPTVEQLKAMAAAVATSGAIALFHLVGITPEAPTLSEVTGGCPVRRTVNVDLDMLRRVRADLTTSEGDEVDVVAFGSPHCTLAELRELATLMTGKRAADDVQVWVSTSRAVREIAVRNGLAAQIEGFGANLTADTCIVVAPLVRPGARTLMTNSAKYAHYGPGLIGVSSVFGSTAACVASATVGAIVRDDEGWR